VDLLVLFVMACALTLATDAAAHSGPPFPVVTDRAAGPYTVSIWTDPDTTNDGAPGGQFWIVLSRRSTGAAPVTRVTVTAAPGAATGATRSVDATVSARDGNTYFGALVLDREGPYRIEVDVSGPQGHVTVRTTVDATYDLRPSPFVAVLYLLPFLLIGALWIRRLVKRPRPRASGGRTSPPPTSDLAAPGRSAP
jgi:hypothetical protein